MATLQKVGPGHTGAGDSLLVWPFLGRVVLGWLTLRVLTKAPWLCRYLLKLQYLPGPFFPLVVSLLAVCSFSPAFCCQLLRNLGAFPFISEPVVWTLWNGRLWGIHTKVLLCIPGHKLINRRILRAGSLSVLTFLPGCFDLHFNLALLFLPGLQNIHFQKSPPLMIRRW